MVDVDSDVFTELSNDAQLSPLIPGGVYYSPLDIPANPKYPLLLYERRQRPVSWADNAPIAYEVIVTIHVMSEGDTNTIMNHVERIMTGLGYVFTDSGPGDEPDCYRDYMVFTITKEV